MLHLIREKPHALPHAAPLVGRLRSCRACRGIMGTGKITSYARAVKARPAPGFAEQLGKEKLMKNMKVFNVFFVIGLILYMLGFAYAENAAENNLSPSNTASSSATNPSSDEYVRATENPDVMALVEPGELNFTGVAVKFYDSKGNSLGRWEKKPGGMMHWEFSPDGRYFLVTMHPSPSEGSKGEAITVNNFILSSTGTVLYQFKSSVSPVFSFAPSGNYLYRSLKGGFEVFGLDGALKWAHKGFGGPHISRNDKYVVSLETETKLAIHDKTGKLLNTIEAPELLQPNKSIRAVSDDGDIFVYLGANEKKLIALDRKGKVIKRLLLKEFPSSARFADKEKREVIIDVWEHIKPGENHRREIKLK